jgi:NodT family efflux transporter outer membrane factor (OMF) lipoprotein
VPHAQPLRFAGACVLIATALATAGCASLPSAPVAVASPTGIAPATWQEPPPALPHAGRTADLARWWSQFDDPLLAELVSQAQAESPTLASARARIEQARAAQVAAGATLGPTLDASATALRGRPDLASRTGTSLSASLQAGWELDLFGGNRAGREAADARLAGAVAGWHDARVSVAADTALTFLQLRACEAQRSQAELDAGSRAETARLTGLSEQAGFQAPSAAALARASAAQGRTLLSAQRAQCDSLVKALVALTGRDEPALRAALAPRTGRLPAAAPLALAVPAVPADVLAQRPDLRSAEADWRAAIADVRQADAARLPRIRLSGAIGATRLSSGETTVQGTTWTIGPVSVTLPILDGGTRAAQSAAAEARRIDAEAQLRARVRAAVREVEDALVQLRSTAERGEDAAVAARDFEASFRAALARQQGGLASLFELEDARRTALAANTALIELQRERLVAWVTLYRAVGGGWTATAGDPGPMSAAAPGDRPPGDAIPPLNR